MIASRWIAMLCAMLAVALCLVALPDGGQAMPSGPGLTPSAPGAGLSRFLQKVDTFPACVTQQRCRTDSNGRRRCGNVERCQECRYVRQCDRQGCAWRQVCQWGPFKPVLQTN